MCVYQIMTATCLLFDSSIVCFTTCCPTRLWWKMPGKRCGAMARHQRKSKQSLQDYPFIGLVQGKFYRNTPFSGKNHGFRFQFSLKAIPPFISHHQNVGVSSRSTIINTLGVYPSSSRPIFSKPSGNQRWQLKKHELMIDDGHLYRSL